MAGTVKVAVHNGARAWRGNEAQVARIARGLRTRGHEVVFSCVAGSPVRERLEHEGFRTTGVRPRGDLDPVSAWRFRRWLARERPNALLLTDLRRMPWGAWAGKGAGVPRVVGRLGLPKGLPKSGPRRWALLRWVDRWYVPTEENRRVLEVSAPAVRGTVHVVPNGVEEPSPVGPVDLVAELGIPEAETVVLGVGAVAPRKGFDLLIRAVAEADEDVHLAIAGDASGAGAERRLARTLGLAGRVHFLGHRDDVTALYAGCDLFVLPSRLEGSPPVLLEAIAAGAPAIVATDVAGVAEVLGASRIRGPEGEGGDGGTGSTVDDPGRGEPLWRRTSTGWLVAPDRGRALAEAVRDALTLRARDPTAYVATGEAARGRVRERFTAERMISGVERVLFG